MSTWKIGDRASYTSRASGHGPTARRGSGSRTCACRGPGRRGRRRRSGWRRREDVLERQRGERREPAGRPAPDAQPVGVDVAPLDEVPAHGGAVLDVGDAPRAAQQVAVGPAVARRAAVVDVDDGEPARRPVLVRQPQHRPGRRRRTAMDEHEQRRALARRAARRRDGTAGSTARGRRRRRRSGSRSAPGTENHAGSMPSVAGRHDRDRRGRRAAPSTSTVTTWASDRRRRADEGQPSTRSARSPSTSVYGRSRRSTAPSASAHAPGGRAPSSTYAKATRPPSRKAKHESPNTHCGNPMSTPRSTITSVPAAGRPAVQAPEPGAVAAEPQRAVAAPTSAGRSTPASPPPATTVRRPPVSTTSRVASHGMSGWSHSSQQNDRAVGAPAGIGDEVRARRRRPRAPTGSSASRRTIVLTASPPPAGCSSWTHSSVEPSGETSPSA